VPPPRLLDQPRADLERRDALTFQAKWKDHPEALARHAGQLARCLGRERIARGDAP